MKKALRTIFSVLAGLLAVGCVGLYPVINGIHIPDTDPPKPILLFAFKFGEQPVEITWAHGSLILAAILLGVAALLWPRQSAEEAAALAKKKRAEERKKKDKATAGAALHAHKTASAEPDFHTPEANEPKAPPPPAPKKAAAPHFEIPDSMKVSPATKDKEEAKPTPAPEPAASRTGGSVPANQVQKSDAVSLATPEEREEAMGRLVAIGQRTLTRKVADQLFGGFFPEIRTIVARVPDNCSGTIEILARQALDLMRFKIKIKDPNLATDQFATFQKKIFEMEKENIAHMYRPKNLDGLQEVQRKHLGCVVSDNDWDRLQRVLLGEREDWINISFANAAEHLQEADSQAVPE